MTKIKGAPKTWIIELIDLDADGKVIVRTAKVPSMNPTSALTSAGTLHSSEDWAAAGRASRQALPDGNADLAHDALFQRVRDQHPAFGAMHQTDRAVWRAVRNATFRAFLNGWARDEDRGLESAESLYENYREKGPHMTLGRFLKAGIPKSVSWRGVVGGAQSLDMTEVENEDGTVTPVEQCGLDPVAEWVLEGWLTLNGEVSRAEDGIDQWLWDEKPIVTAEPEDVVGEGLRCHRNDARILNPCDHAKTELIQLVAFRKPA